MRILDNRVPLQWACFIRRNHILKKLLGDLKAKLPQKKSAAAEESDEEELSEDEITDQIESEDSALDGTGESTQASEISEEDLLEDDEEIEDIEDEADESFLGKLKAKFGSQNAAATPEEKKKRYAFQAIIGLMIVYLAYDIMTTEDVPEVVETSPPVDSPARRARENRPTEASPAVEAPPATEAPAATTPDPIPDPVTDPNASIETKPMPDAAPVIEDPAAQDPVPSEQPTEPMSEAPDTEPFDPGMPDITPMETEPSFEGPGETSSSESSDGQQPDSDGDLTEKILQDLEKQAAPPVKRIIRDYVAPPDYEYRGRGLVYNCTGKHWACVDGPSYRLCEDNITSIKQLGKSVECYPFNVYETSRGCESVQNRMVSSSAKTEFCNEN